MTAMHHPLAQEHWKRDPDFDTIEVSNTGRVRTVSTHAIVPIVGSGGKAHVRVTDKHGRRHDRNVRKLVRKLFGIAPIRIVETGEQAPQPPKTATEKETAVFDPIDEFVKNLKEEEKEQVGGQAGVQSSDAARAAAPQPPTSDDADIVALRWPGVRDGFRISRNGEVYSPSVGKVDGSVNRGVSGSYRVMNLPRVEGSPYTGYLQVRLDELVATHFVGPKPQADYVAKHLNGDLMDNRAENLEWAPRVRQTFKPTRFTARGKQRTASPIRQQRIKEMAADPNWRQVTHTKIVPGHYWISRDGVARGLSGRDLTTFEYEDGHIGVYMKSLETNNATTVRVDELVLEAFGEKRPSPKHRVIHRNGLIADCRAENLYWGTSGKRKVTPEPEPTPDPQPTPVITPTKATVKVTTLASYRVGDVEVIVNNGIIEPPTGGTAVEQAAALAQIYAEIAKEQG